MSKPRLIEETTTELVRVTRRVFVDPNPSRQPAPSRVVETTGEPLSEPKPALAGCGADVIPLFARRRSA